MNLRRTNRRAVLDAFLRADSFSIAELSSRARLSKPTVMRIVEHLESLDLVRSVGKGESTGEGGRKPLRYSVNLRHSHAVAYHIFAGEIYAVITDMRARILARRSAPVPPTISFEDTLDIMTEQYRDLVAEIDTAKPEEGRIAGVAVGSHGITDFETGTTLYSPHFEAWGENAAFRDGLAARIGLEVPIIVDNQIRFQVVSEQRFGSTPGRRNLIVVEAGEGLVAGIISNGEIRRGSHSLAGEIGHIVIDPDGTERCACGSCGCFESKVCEAQLQRLARKAGLPAAEASWTTAIFDAARGGDSAARKAMSEVAHWFALGFQTLVLVYDPDAIVIQGIYADAGDWFLEAIQSGIAGLSLSRVKKKPAISYSTIGRDRGVLGAASLVLDAHLSAIYRSSL